MESTYTQQHAIRSKKPPNRPIQLRRRIVPLAQRAQRLSNHLLQCRNIIHGGISEFKLLRCFLRFGVGDGVVVLLFLQVRCVIGGTAILRHGFGSGDLGSAQREERWIYVVGMPDCKVDVFLIHAFVLLSELRYRTNQNPANAGRIADALSFPTESPLSTASQYTAPIWCVNEVDKLKR